MSRIILKPTTEKLSLVSLCKLGTTGGLPPLTGTDGNAVIEVGGSAAFRPIDDAYLFGGWRVVADITARDAIPSGKRKEGMWVAVISDGKVYNLVGGIGNVNWQEVVFGDGTGMVDITVEPLVLQVNPATGTDPTSPTRYQTQTQVDAHGAFATISGAIDTVPSDLRHGVTLELADGAHVLGKDGFGKLARFFSEVTEHDPVAWWPPITYGYLKLKSKNGLVRVAGTSTMTVNAVTDLGYGISDVQMTADPGFVADTYRAYFLRVMTGTYAGRLVPIFHHTGDTFNVASAAVSLVSTDTVEIVEAAAQIDVQATVNGYVIQPSSPSLFFILDAIDVIDSLADGSDLEWNDGQLWIVNGARFLQSGGCYITGGLLRFGDAIIKASFGVYGKATVVIDDFQTVSTHTAFFSYLQFYGNVDNYIGRDFYWLVSFSKPTYVSQAGVVFDGPGRVQGNFLYTPECYYGATLGHGAWLQTAIANAHGTSFDASFDGVNIASWYDILTPAIGEQGSRIG